MSIAPQHSIIPTALSRISEDSTKPTVPHRCLNIAGIEKYPDLQGALPRAWSVPALAPHVRAYLEAPLVCNLFIIIFELYYNSNIEFNIKFMNIYILYCIEKYVMYEYISFSNIRFNKLHSMIYYMKSMS